MLRKLNETAPTLALADDLVAVCDGLFQLNQYLTKLEKLCEQYGFVVNKKKSAIMEVRKDHRQPGQGGVYHGGYPLVSNYKYLGLQVDTCLKWEVLMTSKKDVLKSLKQKQWILRKK